MRFEEGLNDVFARRSHVRVLRELVELDGYPVSIRDIARRSRLTHPTVSDVVSDLNDIGLVRVERSPAQDRVSLNADHYLAEPLRLLFGDERRMKEHMKERLKGSLRPIEGILAASLFGSVTHGPMSPTSDIDIAILALPGAENQVLDRLVSVQDEVRELYGNHLAPLVAAVDASRGTFTPPAGSEALWEGIGQRGTKLVNDIRELLS